eukprot:CAMPEP_0204918428 /NCGR_PEP_ID=MMETSP1397-20131031/16149_1 /ASSEMBLY_ACC=CAM_ASM_000891 /TAXON_ID=49980 /ORGANISM="Climacostomum Climacostomum virens, Strain Stock W-24" /LENGTH=128 /DNA_ID=CAMNT_0052091715 /DNA_START=11 /DNA_END=394 /DNA_ORIENTATION=+
MLRMISLIKTCCGGTSEEVSERVEKLTQKQQASSDVLILKSISKEKAIGGSVAGNPEQDDSSALAEQPDQNKHKKKRKKKPKKPAQASDVVESVGLQAAQEDDSLEAKKDMSKEEQKSQAKPLKGILK